MEDSWLTVFRSATPRDAARPLVVALATVDVEGSPQVRSVICRLIDDDGSLWFTSDARSAKNAQLERHPLAAAVCWLAESRQQFRFNGPVTICRDESERKRLWESLKPETRVTFGWPAPGAPLDAAASFATTSDAAVPPADFSVLVLRPTAVEHLDLTKQPHRRRRWRADDGWRRRELNP